MVKIDEEKCNGCGACVTACHEGAIELVNGKARLIREDYCDGLGDCLPVCPVDAIRLEECEALPYDEQAVQAAMSAKASKASDCAGKTKGRGCPGTQARTLLKPTFLGAKSTTNSAQRPSELAQWPVQLKLVPVNAAFFQDADLLLAADCTAFSYARFHEDFIKGRVCLIGCPKLDAANYALKLEQILCSNDIKSFTVVRMQVPCCGGLELAARQALQISGKSILMKVLTLSTDGTVL